MPLLLKGLQLVFDQTHLLVIGEVPYLGEAGDGRGLLTEHPDLLARLGDEVEPDQEKDHPHLLLARMLAEGPLRPDFFDFLLLLWLGGSLIAVVFDLVTAVEPREETVPDVEVALRPGLGLLLYLFESFTPRLGLVRLGIMVRAL